MKILKDFQIKDIIYNQIYFAAKQEGSQVYLVGGCVRDLILDRPVFDIDLLVYGSRKFIALLQEKIPSTLICLDKEREIFRLALRKSKVTIDIALEDPHVPLSRNLVERDFTVNAMAIELAVLFNAKGPSSDILIDPFNGRLDAQKGIIRMVEKVNLVSDPLRMLRAFRLGAQFAFSIHKKTLDAISENIMLINKISPERIHDEWIKLMRSDNAAPYIEQMKNTGLLEQIFPEMKPMEELDQGCWHTLMLWEHSLATLFHIEEMLNVRNVFLTSRLKRLLTNRLKRGGDGNHVFCLKTAALFHDLGKPGVRGIGKRGQVTFYGHPRIGAQMLRTRMGTLRFSNMNILFTTRLVQDHMRPLLLSQAKGVTDKAVASLFIHLGETWPALLFLSVADVQSTLSDEGKIKEYIGFVDYLCAFMEEMEEREDRAPLITGNDLVENLFFPPGPMMGKALRRIKHAYLSGAIKTKQEALKIAKTYLGISKKLANDRSKLT